MLGVYFARDPRLAHYFAQMSRGSMHAFIRTVYIYIERVNILYNVITYIASSELFVESLVPVCSFFFNHNLKYARGCTSNTPIVIIMLHNVLLKFHFHLYSFLTWRVMPIRRVTSCCIAQKELPD